MDTSSGYLRDAFMRQTDTLFTMIHQNNIKEEQVFYPAVDPVLNEGRSVLIDIRCGCPRKADAAGSV